MAYIIKSHNVPKTSNNGEQNLETEKYKRIEFYNIKGFERKHSSRYLFLPILHILCVLHVYCKFRSRNLSQKFMFINEM